MQLCIVITWAKKNCGLNTRGLLSLCFELFYWQEVWNDNCLYEKSCHSCHLFSWSWRAKVNENSFYLKLWRIWMGSTARFLQSWKRSVFFINICLFLFLLMLQNSVYTSFCVIICCFVVIIFIVLTGSQLAWRTWIRTTKNPVGNRRFH